MPGMTVHANVLELINVEQATGAIAVTGGTANNNSCIVHPPSDTLNVATLGEYLYSVAAVNGSALDANPNSSGQTITEQKNVVGPTTVGTVAGYLKAPATGPRTVSWALSSCSSTVHALISIKPAKTP